jgi:dTDP-4-amino-4,6-dideoxygalactose transaminase
MKNKILLSSPHMGGSEQKYIKEAFDTNWIVPMGENINRFENDLEEYIGCNSKISCVSSGTSAIHLSLVLAGVKRNDEVICQSMTFSASANPILYLGAKPVFIDSEQDTWNMCPIALEEAILERISLGIKPKAIIVVHLYGMPAKIEAIVAISQKYKIILIEDSAESLGSSFKGRKCGAFGDYGILSFNGNKIITTSGGGALICKTSEQKNKAVFLATQAKDDAIHYQHSEIGYNYRMSNVLAGIGRGQMEVLDKHISLRRDNNEFYQNLFKNIKGVKVHKEFSPDYFSNHWLTCITIDEKISNFNKDELSFVLNKDNIESRPLWKPLHLQPIFSSYKFYGKDICENLFNTGLCLPSGSNLSKDEKSRITNAIKLF